jgi:hypothetical protein
VATVRLAEDDVPDLVAALTAGLSGGQVADDGDAEAG